MSVPLFRMQIVDVNGKVVIDPFTAGPMELSFIDGCVEDIMTRGVGFWRTEAHVEQDIRDGMRAAIQGLKDRTRVVARHYSQ